LSNARGSGEKRIGAAMRSFATGLTVLTAVGCAHHQPPMPSNLTFGPRTDLGAIAVVAPAAPNPGRLAGPTTRGESALAGAITGSAASLYVGFQLGWAGAILGVAAAPFVGAVGATVGAFDGASASEVNAARAPLERAIIEADIPRTLRDRVVEIGVERTRETFLPLTGPLDSSGPVAARTLLELRVVEVRLGALARSTNLVRPLDRDPWLVLSLKVRVRLVEIANRTEIFTRDVEVGRESRLFSEWVADHGHHFRTALAEAIEAVAGCIVDVLF